MANTILKKKSTRLTKKEAIEAIKKAYRAGSNTKLAEAKKNYSGDFEQVFVKAMTDGDEDDAISQIDMLADRVIRNLTLGTEWDSTGNYTNEYQLGLDKFRLYSLVIKMNDDGVFLPESILDERLMARLNNAAHDLGYDEDIYELERVEKEKKNKDDDDDDDKDKKAKYKVDTTKKCINPKKMDEKDINKVKDEDLKALFKIQLQDIEAYLIETGKYDFTSDDEDDDKEVEVTDDIDTSDLPHWMRYVREQRINDDDDEDEDDDETPKKKSGKKTSKNKKDDEDEDFVVKKTDKKATGKKLSKSSNKEEAKTEEPKQELAVVTPQQPQVTPVQQPTQQVFYGYNPATGTPAHYETMPTAQPAPAAPVETAKKEEDVEDIFSSLFSEDQQTKIETAFMNMGEDKAKELLKSEEFKNGLDALISLIITPDQKEGAKSSKKLNKNRKKN